MDDCKMVSTTLTVCSNFFWTDEGKFTTVVSRIKEPDFRTVSTSDCRQLLEVGLNGCEKICALHDVCKEVGSECKNNGVCLNLFWNPGPVVREEMTTCYGLSSDGCFDGIPILCQQSLEIAEFNDNQNSSQVTPTSERKKIEGAMMNIASSQIGPFQIFLPFLSLLTLPGFLKL